MKFKIGIIDYLNTQLFQYNLEEQLRPRGVTFMRGVPTELNHALLDGRIDLAPISAFFAAEHSDEFVILPGHSISSLGAVKTVLLFSWRPDMRELDGETIALTDHSATSIALLQVLCQERYAIRPNFITMPQELPRMMQQASAALVIGDTALVESFLHRELPRGDYSYGRPTIFDLGDEWLKLTGLPFTFAVWAARRDSVDQLLSLDVSCALQASKTAGVAHLHDIAAAYAPTLSLPPGVCARYLRDLRYDLTPSDLEGLTTFLEMALPPSLPTNFTFLQEAAVLEEIP